MSLVALLSGASLHAQPMTMPPGAITGVFDDQTSRIDPAYGSKNPVSFMAFLRLKTI